MSKSKTDKESLAAYRETYPTECFWCGEALGPPPGDEELRVQIEEHDRLFPEAQLETGTVICDKCFLAHCPGGNRISIN